MKFFSLLMLAASAIAAPVARSTDAQHFHLKSTGATNESHNNLYVYAYHTGAGLNDAVLTDDVNTASAVYLNGTRANFDLKSDLSWGVVATGNTNYASWEPIQINAGQGSEGFSIKDNKFQLSEDSGFGGWLVCDWYHNAPQLFYLDRYHKATIPSSCSEVKLEVENIK